MLYFTLEIKYVNGEYNEIENNDMEYQYAWGKYTVPKFWG